MSLGISPDEVSLAVRQHDHDTTQAWRYGTAGFRAPADTLEGVAMRCGCIAALRALQSRSLVGVVVTASHNPEGDNGIKIVDQDGAMLCETWERHATQLAQSASAQAVHAFLCEVIAVEGIHAPAHPKEFMRPSGVNRGTSELQPDTSKAVLAASVSAGKPPAQISGACVALAIDSRPSSLKLAECVATGIWMLEVSIVCLGMCATPIAHYAVWKQGDADPRHYFSRLAEGFASLTAEAPSAPPTVCVVDCANGVGAASIDLLQDVIDPSVLELQPCNLAALGHADAGKVNEKCGSDYAQTQRAWPQRAQGVMAASQAQLCAALDGDADRIVFLAPQSERPEQPFVLDGDFIACLLTRFLLQQLQAAQLTHLTIGMVQTAYANGASTAYIREQLRVPVLLAKTGVKHLHAASQQFDIGVYFEANGHGSVTFSSACHSAIEAGLARSKGTAASREMAALRMLQGTEKVINPAIGDAMSGLLVAVAVLRISGLAVQQWTQLYTPLCARLATLRVADRHAIATDHCETRVTAPAALQEAIDAAVSGVQCGRAFARPSGTEDVVRVYAEAATQPDCEQLCLLVLQAVHAHAGGIADAPPQLT